MIDPYKIFGIGKSATPAEIKRKYKKLSSKYHPDRAEGDTAEMSEVNKAYAVIGNAKSREKYDKYGITGRTPGFEERLNTCFCELIITAAKDERPLLDVMRMILQNRKEQVTQANNNNKKVFNLFELKIHKTSIKAGKGRDIIKETLLAEIDKIDFAIKQNEETLQIINVVFDNLEDYINKEAPTQQLWSNSGYVVMVD